MLTIIPILAVCIFSLGGGFRLRNPKPFLDKNKSPLPASISEKIWVNINGVEQGMFIESYDTANPVVLFVHGGPGMPEHFLTDRYPTGLERYFTVCWWEQRGSGLSYQANLPRETITFEQLIADTIEVTNYLRQRFGKEKIYLLAHSWGSFIGIQVAAQAPELYYAYLGMSQVTYQLKSEKLAYEYMLEQFRAQGNLKMVRKLEKAPPTLTGPLPAAYNRLRDGVMHQLGIGTTHDMKSIVTGVFLRSLVSRDYTLKEKVNLWRGKLFSQGILRDKAFATDLTRQVQELKLPVYFFEGKHDYTCSYTEAKSYFERLKAPLKGFYSFEHSAHTPLFEEPEKMRKILLEDVLAGVTNLADATEKVSSKV